MKRLIDAMLDQHDAEDRAPTATHCSPSADIVESARYWALSANSVKDNREYREAFERFRDEILRLASLQSATESTTVKTGVYATNATRSFEAFDLSSDKKQSIYADKTDAALIEYGRDVIRTMKANGYGGIVWDEVLDRFERLKAQQEWPITRWQLGCILANLGASKELVTALDREIAKRSATSAVSAIERSIDDADQKP